jgi:hypothetical protein
MDKSNVIAQIKSNWDCKSFNLNKLGKIDYKTCTIYHLFFDDVLVYVGQTVDLRGRLQAHRADKKKFDSVTYFNCPYEDKDKVELEQIKLYKPILNSSGISIEDKIDAIESKNYIICRNYKVVKKSDCIEKDNVLLFWETKIDNCSRNYVTTNWHFDTVSRKISLREIFKTFPPNNGKYSLEDIYLENKHLVQSVVRQTAEQKKDLGKLIFKCGKYKGRQFKLCTDESYKKWYAKTILNINY